MDSQTKRTLAATLLCLVALFVWFKIQEVRYRDRLPTTQPAAMIAADEPTSKPVHAAAPATVETKPAEPPALTAPRYRTESADSTATVVLGSDIQDRPGQDDANPYEFAVVVSPIGASVEAIRLANDRNHIAKDPRNPDHDPYGLLEVVRDPETGEVYRSFATEQIRFREEHQKNYEVVGLADVVWSLEKSADDRGETATLRTRIRTEDAAVLELEKVYRLDKGARQLDIFLAVRNLALPTSDILVTERGPIGLKKEDPRSDYRRIVSAIVDAEGVAKLGATMTRAEVFKADEDGRLLRPAEGEKLLWAAASNKFFTCIVTPLLENPSEPSADEAVAGTVGRLAAAACFKDPKAADDLTFDWVMASSRPLRKGQRLTLHLDAFCGPKSDKLFETMPDRNYHIVRDADSRWCTFQAITTLMLWLLNAIYGVTHNYGVAIIVLVIIVRLVLHPISRHGQITMMKMQKNQQRIKPKIDALQRQYKNDKQKINEETMKLYREEGINPAGTILGCLPMALQMPIWVALWTALNTNVHMRHMPFFGYIRDLSAPDALIGFAQTYNIPVLHYLMG
ncbi:MAG: membrane protein insertase YidC, partial [Phycisphaerae bacterium]